MFNEHTPSAVVALHRKAMTHLDYAAMATLTNHPDLARRYKADALDLETQAATMLPPLPEHALARAVLHRSAAWIAHGAGQLDTAVTLALAGLAPAGEAAPPPAIHTELVEVLWQAAGVEVVSECLGGTLQLMLTAPTWPRTWPRRLDVELQPRPNGARAAIILAAGYWARPDVVATIARAMQVAVAIGTAWEQGLSWPALQAALGEDEAEAEEDGDGTKA